MNDQFAFQRAEHQDCFGYFFHHSESGIEWGSPQLDVNLRADPTERHFDPEYLRLRIVEQNEEVEHMRIYHPWPGRPRLHVVLGDVVIRDRKEKTVEAFTFGGTLDIERSEGCTRCSLTSAVPIIDLRDNHIEAHFLAAEAKGLIARRRMDWEHDPERFEARIANADAERLYFAILLRLEEEYRIYPKDNRLNAQEFLKFLHKQIDEAKKKFSPGQLPADIEAIV